MRSHKCLPLFVIGILSMACFVCLVSSQAQSSDADAIRNLIQKLFDSYQRKDLHVMISSWDEKSPFLAGNRKALQQEFATYEKIEVKRSYIYQMQITADMEIYQQRGRPGCCNHCRKNR